MKNKQPLHPDFIEPWKLRNGYIANVFQWVVLSYSVKHKIEIQASVWPLQITRLISRGSDENGDFEEYWCSGNDIRPANTDSHMTIIRKIITFIRFELAIPLDEGEFKRGYLL